MEIKTKKILSILSIVSMAAVSVASTNADIQIGTGSIVWSGTTSTINWDEVYGGTDNASGSIEDIRITAQVLPSLNMEIGSWSIDLGNLSPGVAGSGSVGIEVGTNSADGLSITARSQNAGLQNINDNTIYINDDTFVGAQDGIAESYTYGSTKAIAANDDSDFAMTTTDKVDAEVKNNTDEYVIYTSDTPEDTDGTNADLTFDVGATTNAQTPAGLYEDFVIFTVTANF